ncbi:MAG: GIY-YIG nuclease family protein [Patescibacteria group bacterium]|nr:GIY-YIG nuclease family protein [Patescibacteria group bacterium]
MIEPEFISIPLERSKLNAGLPASNGVYRFKRDNEVLYVGKSVNLKARVISHIESAKLDRKEAAIVSNSNAVDYFVTDTEFKALLLEAELIRSLRPPYNVRWRDDKSYLYIKVTWNELYPKIMLSRREDDKKSRYFGPFPSSRIAQEMIRQIRRVFPFCTQKQVGKRACFYQKIGLCNPCPSMIEHLADQSEKSRLTTLYRQQVRQVMKVLEGNTAPILKDLYEAMNRYAQAEKFEDAIVVRDKILRLETFLHGRNLDKRLEEVYNRSEENMISLQQLLSKYFPELPIPRRIECFDVSNTSQQQSTASMVVMTDGIINKKEYRKFRIKNELLQSDFDMLVEVITRRINQKKWPVPDLLVIDGGKPQLRVVQRVMAEQGFKVPVIGIAKNPDRIVIGQQEMTTLRPTLQHPGFTLLRALRDESHRFAKKYHVLLRNKQQLV